jgi:hypothetical protein
MGLPCKYCGYPYTISGVCDSEGCQSARQSSDSTIGCILVFIVGVAIVAWIVRTITAIFAWVYKEVVAFGVWIASPVPLATVAVIFVTPIVVVLAVHSISVTRQGVPRTARYRRMILNFSLAVALIFPTAWAVLRATNAPNSASKPEGVQPKHDQLKDFNTTSPAVPRSIANGASAAAGTDGEPDASSDLSAQGATQRGASNSAATQDGSLRLVGFVDFSTPDAPSQGIVITAGSNFGYFESFGGNWRITAKDGGFTGRFSAPSKGRYYLAVTHLSSSASPCSGNGFSPITISLNSIPIVEDYDPAEHHHGSHDWVKDTWSFPVEPGFNTLNWKAGALCTDYWIQRVDLLSGTETVRN